MEKQMFKIAHKDGAKSLVGISLQGSKLNLVHLKGRMIDLSHWCFLLMDWDPTANAVKEYCESTRKHQFNIVKNQTSGRASDLRLMVYKQRSGFEVAVKTAEMHVSMCDKLNQGVWRGYVGDFVEFVAFYYEGTDIPALFNAEVGSPIQWPAESEGCIGLSSVTRVEPATNSEYRKQFRLPYVVPEVAAVVPEETDVVKLGKLARDEFLRVFSSGKVAVQCRTKCQAATFLDILNKHAGLFWSRTYKSVVCTYTGWELHEHETVYQCDAEDGGLTLHEWSYKNICGAINTVECRDLLREWGVVTDETQVS